MTGDCARVSAVVGAHETDCGALVIVKDSDVDVTAYVEFAGAVATMTHVPGAVKEITAEDEFTVHPDVPAESTAYVGLPVPVLIDASDDAAEPESLAVRVVVGLHVIERVARPTVIVKETGDDAA